MEFAWNRELWNTLTGISAVTHILKKQIAKFRKLHKDNSLYNKKNMTFRIYRKFDTFETIEQIFKERVNSECIGRIVFNKVFQILSRTDKFAFYVNNAYYCLMFHEQMLEANDRCFFKKYSQTWTLGSKTKKIIGIILEEKNDHKLDARK